MEFTKHDEISAFETGQKYKIGSIVKIKEEYGHKYRGHFCVVENTSARSRAITGDFNIYRLIVLDDDCYPISGLAWLLDCELELISDAQEDVEYGNKLIDYYISKKYHII